MKGRVLAVGGSDSSGGAGIQADIKTITALGGYAATAVTAVTVQDTRGVTAIHAVPPDIVSGQMTAVLDDIGADCVKLGMLGGAAVAAAVADILEDRDLALVVDPVMASSGGQELLDEEALGVLADRLIPLAAVVTPNLAEAEALTGIQAAGPGDMARCGQALVARGAGAALITGGHLEGQDVTDVLVTAAGQEVFTSPRIQTKSGHGTGCTLASAIACGLAQGLDLGAAVARARAFVAAALRAAPGLGSGPGPLDHGHAIPPYSG